MASLVTNSLAMLAARLAVPLFSFGINVGIARMLGSHVLGQYVELVALLLIAQALAGGGLSVLMTRDVAAHLDERAELLRRGTRVGIASGLAGTLLFLVYAAIALPSDSLIAGALLAASILPSAWISAQEGFFMGTQLHPLITRVALVEGVTKLLASGVVLVMGGGLIGLCASLTLARFVALAQSGLLAKRSGGERPFARPADGALEFGRALVPFAAIMTLGILYFRQDVLVVGALRSESETGLYGVATTLYALTLLGPNSLMSVVYPRLSAAFAHAREDYHDATILTSKLLTVFGTLMALGLIAVGPLLVRGLYGAEFLPAIPVLSLLAAVLPLHGLNAAVGQALQAAHLQHEILGLTIGAVVLNLGLNLALVPILGIEGAAAALLTTSALSALVLGWIYHRRVSPFSVGLRALTIPVAVALPIGLVLASPEAWRIPAAIGASLVLALGARLSGLVGAGDLGRIGAGLGLRRGAAAGSSA